MEEKVLVTKALEKALEIANQLFAQDEKSFSKDNLKELVGEELFDYTEIIIGSLKKTEKFKGRRNASGIAFAGNGKHQKISDRDKGIIKDYINKEISKPKNNKPEEDVQTPFKNWFIKTVVKDGICKSRSSSRAAEKWKNVDGYWVTIEELEYHLSFRPILTTFEVKPSIPNIEGISQARNYLNFSHHVYLVFEDQRSREEIMDNLHKNGFNDSDGMGVYVTKDKETFEKIQNTNSIPPNEIKVEQAIVWLLDDEDKNKLKKMRTDYLTNHVLKPVINR